MLERRPIEIVAILLLTAALTACASAPVADSVHPAEAHSRAVLWVQSSAEYRAATLQAFALATERVEEAARSRAAGAWAVVVDADETILSNVDYQLELEAIGARFEVESWNAFCRRRVSRAIPGAREFLERVGGLGGRVVVVTNRRTVIRRATADNLRQEALPFDLLVMREGESDKGPRWRAVEEGTASANFPPLEIVLWMGDNIEDFPGLDQSVSDDPAALATFSERFVIMPNPMYGSWE